MRPCAATLDPGRPWAGPCSLCSIAAGPKVAHRRALLPWRSDPGADRRGGHPVATRSAGQRAPIAGNRRTHAAFIGARTEPIGGPSPAQKPERSARSSRPGRPPLSLQGPWPPLVASTGRRGAGALGFQAADDPGVPDASLCHACIRAMTRCSTGSAIIPSPAPHHRRVRPPGHGRTLQTRVAIRRPRLDQGVTLARPPPTQEQE